MIENSPAYAAVYKFVADKYTEILRFRDVIDPGTIASAYERREALAKEGLPVNDPLFVLTLALGAIGVREMVMDTARLEIQDEMTSSATDGALIFAEQAVVEWGVILAELIPDGPFGNK